MQEFKFSLELVNEILQVLGEQKAKDVFNVIVKIHETVAKQTSTTAPEKE
jgi:hypothetical protein